MFADNHRISKIQMERQYLLAYLGPVVLWIVPELRGRNGVFSILAGAVILCVWVFFLLRQIHVFRYPEKYWGACMSIVILLIFESYLILTGGWLAAMAGKLLREYLIEGIPHWIAAALFVAAALGSSHNMQSRGRFAQVAWPIAGLIAGLMFLLAAFQGQGGNSREMRQMQEVQNSFTMNLSDGKEILRGIVWWLAALLGTILIPFLEVENDGGSEHTGYFRKMIGKLALWTGAISILLTNVFGVQGTAVLRYPVLNLMAGVKIPGGFVRRIDMIFLTVILFGLLFSLGSVMFYSRYLWSRIWKQQRKWKKKEAEDENGLAETDEIAGLAEIDETAGNNETDERVGKDKTDTLRAEKLLAGRVPWAVLCFLAAAVEWGGWSVMEEYPSIVCWIYLPVFAAITFCNGFLRRRKVKKFLVMVPCVLLLSGTLSGCRIVEPEKRAYPLVVAIDRQQGQYQVYLAMAQLAESTGQGKSGGEEQNGDDEGGLLLTGDSKEEILEIYNKTQELYLDPGHIQAVLFGKGLLEEPDGMRHVLLEMEAENGMGNSAYVFSCEQPEEILKMNGNQVESLGKYLAGIYENRTGEEEPVTLSQMYWSVHNRGQICEMPLLQVREGELYVEAPAENCVQYSR